jgi:predicted unusual protein kinase regulating ubiquinone biosynthesis (AarF/ABC1/UbiB family)
MWFHITGNSQKMYEEIFDAVEKLGGLYVKLLQFLSLRANLFPDHAKLRFLTFFDQVPIEPLNVKEILKEDLGNNYNSHFLTIEEVPFASGSFGQVYGATLTNGKNVIIKIQRPDVENKLYIDFIIIKILGFFVDLLFDQSFVNVPKLIREFESITHNELDYISEVNNALLLYEMYKFNPMLHIPFTYKNLSTKRIIVQDYVGGVSVTDLLRMRAENVDCNRWLEENLHTNLADMIKHFSYDISWQIFTQDTFYSDPHPGNIKILPNNQYAYIDFGIIGKSPENKKEYFSVIKNLCQDAQYLDAMDLSKVLLSIGTPHFYDSLKTYDRVLSDTNNSLTQTVLNRYAERIEEWKIQLERMQKGDKENYTDVWIDLFTLGEQFQMQLPEGLFAGLRASALISSFTRFLDPNIQVMTTIYQEITRDIDEKTLNNGALDEKKKITLEDAVETVSTWFSDLAEKDLLLYSDISRFSYTIL